jgi:hypothetical protein
MLRALALIVAGFLLASCTAVETAGRTLRGLSRRWALRPQFAQVTRDATRWAHNLRPSQAVSSGAQQQLIITLRLCAPIQKEHACTTNCTLRSRSAVEPVP